MLIKSINVSRIAAQSKQSCLNGFLYCVSMVILHKEREHLVVDNILDNLTK